MKAMIIVNPSSGSEEAEEYLSQLKTRLNEKFEEVLTKETKKAGDAKKFSAQASLERFDAIFLMGGDGTANEGINGVAKQDYHPMISIIPMGTINNFARVLGISMDPKMAIDELDFTSIKKIDVGKVNDLFFTSTVSVGSIPKTVQNVDKESKAKFGSLAYFIEGIKALNDDETSTFQITLDGNDFEDDYSLVLIGLSQSVVGVDTVFASAEIDDGYLNLLCLKETTATEKMKLIPELLEDDESYSDNLVVKRFKKGYFKTKQDKEYVTTVDGNRGPAFPIHVEIFKQLLSVYVPSNK